MKKLRVSSPLNLHFHSKNNNSEYIRAGLIFHKEAGFDAADLGMGLLDLASDGWEKRAERAFADSKEIGVSFDICHLPFISGGGAMNEEYMTLFNTKMHRAIDAAAYIGVDYAVMHPNATSIPMKTYDRREQYDMVMSHLAPFAKHAARVGVNVVVENMRNLPSVVAVHRYGQSPDELCEIADALGIGVCWDFGHANISGLKQSEGLAYVGKRLKIIHVNDNGAIEDEHLLPFEGNVDWRDAMHGLALAGYEGTFNFELSTSRLPESVRKPFAAYMIEAAKELMSYIE